jgi:hypothetical protein
MAGYPRTAEQALTVLYEAADDRTVSVLDELLRAAGLRWEHVGCWTNSTKAGTCEHCGRRRSTLEANGEVLP